MGERVHPFSLLSTLDPEGNSLEGHLEHLGEVGETLLLLLFFLRLSSFLLGALFVGHWGIRFGMPDLAGLVDGWLRRLEE
jgi:hypothetical protein